MTGVANRRFQNDSDGWVGTGAREDDKAEKIGVSKKPREVRGPSLAKFFDGGSTGLRKKNPGGERLATGKGS